MAEPSKERYYPLTGVNFRDFWDICTSFQQVHHRYVEITYTIDGRQGYIALEEKDVARVLEQIKQTRDTVRQYIARFYAVAGGDYSSTELIYRPEPYDDYEAGLYFFSETATKLSIYEFEELVSNNYSVERGGPIEIEFGQPCEILAAAVDLRELTTFTLAHELSAPYHGAVLTALRATVEAAFAPYPPERMSIAREGVFSVWEIGEEDRQVALDVCVDACTRLNSDWQVTRHHPDLSSGAPDTVVAGVSCGTACRLDDGAYLGPPIDVANALSASCPKGRFMLDHAAPRPTNVAVPKENTVKVPPFGTRKVWLLDCD